MLYHMTHRMDWEDAVKKGTDYVPPHYTEDGFIHTSKTEQILPTANRLYTGVRDLVLLVVDESKVPSKIVEEPSRSGEMFAHIYGSLPLAAVITVYDFPPDDSGEFTQVPFKEEK